MILEKLIMMLYIFVEFVTWILSAARSRRENSSGPNKLSESTLRGYYGKAYSRPSSDNSV